MKNLFTTTFIVMILAGCLPEGQNNLGSSSNNNNNTINYGEKYFYEYCSDKMKSAQGADEIFGKTKARTDNEIKIKNLILNARNDSDVRDDVCSCVSKTNYKHLRPEAREIFDQVGRGAPLSRSQAEKLNRVNIFTDLISWKRDSEACLVQIANDPPSDMEDGRSSSGSPSGARPSQFDSDDLSIKSDQELCSLAGMTLGSEAFTRVIQEARKRRLDVINSCKRVQ